MPLKVPTAAGTISTCAQVTSGSKMAGMSHPALAKAIEIVGLSEMAKALDVTYQAIRKWEAQGRLPRTEWTGETQYATKIARLSKGAVTKRQLLERHAVEADPGSHAEHAIAMPGAEA